MSKFSIFLVVALVACSGRVEPDDFALADQQCSNHGGTASVARYEHGKHITIVCKSGLLVEVYKHNVESKP